jgi:hypothetical protein
MSSRSYRHARSGAVVVRQASEGPEATTTYPDISARRSIR